MTRREFAGLVAAPVGAFLAHGNAAGAMPSDIAPCRRVVVVRDVSPSYENTPAIADKLIQVARSLGPGDTFHLIELGGPFRPEACVKIQCVMPAITSDLLAPVQKLSVWRQRQAHLASVWKSVEANKGAIVEFLQQSPKIKDGTPLYETLTYAASLLAPPSGATEILLVFSDLVQDSDGVKSELPPKTRFDLTGMRVYALFVPWKKDFSRRGLAWRRWFVDVCGAQEFAMLDRAASQVALVLEQSKAPSVLAQSF